MDISWCSVFCAIIIFVSIKFFIPLLLILYRFFISARSLQHVKKYKRSADDWAVITGGTDGIGKAYAEQLAAIGFNICIISRSLDKLEKVATDIKENYSVKTKVIQANFTQTDIYQTFRDEFKQMRVIILVNNVGMTQPYPCPIAELPVEDSFYIGFANCNMTSAVMTTRCALQEGGMLERNHGLIINVSSASGMHPWALASMYTSTKAFLDFFSRGIQVELKKTKIQVQSVLPFYVLTKFIGKFRPPRLLAPSADEYVRSALCTVGVEDRTHGTLSHSIQGLVMNQPPEWIRNRVSFWLHSLRAKILLENASGDSGSS